MSFITACQLRLRLPLTLLAGITQCSCGAHVDPYGDHCLSCVHFRSHRTHGHDLIQDDVAALARRALHHISRDSRRPRAVSLAYSPHHCPDLTFLHGSPAGSHLIVDITTTSVVKQSALPAAALDCRVCSDAAAADKHHVYGAVAPHVVLPFVVEHAGALGREADKFFHACVKKARNDLSPFEEAASSWSCRGLSNWYYQKISVSNLKGLGHFFMVVGAMLRTANGVAFV